MDAKDIDVLRYAVDNQYWYTMFIGMTSGHEMHMQCTDCSVLDDLPVSGTVGRDESADEPMDPHFKPLYVYTHKSFTFEYNRNQVGEMRVACKMTLMALLG